MKPVKNNVPGPGQYHIPRFILDVYDNVITNTNSKKEFRSIKENEKITKV
jgi:hypothetical protein